MPLEFLAARSPLFSSTLRHKLNVFWREALQRIKANSFLLPRWWRWATHLCLSDRKVLILTGMARQPWRLFLPHCFTLGAHDNILQPSVLQSTARSTTPGEPQHVAWGSAPVPWGTGRERAPRRGARGVHGEGGSKATILPLTHTRGTPLTCCFSCSVSILILCNGVTTNGLPFGCWRKELYNLALIV